MSINFVEIDSQMMFVNRNEPGLNISDMGRGFFREFEMNKNDDRFCYSVFL